MEDARSQVMLANVGFQVETGSAVTWKYPSCVLKVVTVPRAPS